LAPYTAIARPAVRETKERRVRPVPAGAGIPASMAGSPRPGTAAEAALRRSLARESPSHPQAWTSTRGGRESIALLSAIG
jgi:hypothetical protein